MNPAEVTPDETHHLAPGKQYKIGDAVAALGHLEETADVIYLKHPPTAEVMGLILEQKPLETLPESVSDVSVTVRETSELCAGVRINAGQLDG